MHNRSALDATRQDLNRDCPTTPRRRSRTEEGKIICFGCGEVGHIRPFCLKHHQQGRAPSQWQENKDNQLMGLVGSGGSQQDRALLILKIDVKRTVTQEVLCGDKRVSAVINIGAACSSNLAEELKLVITPWRKNRLVSIDGKEITPVGAAWLSVSDGVTKVEGGGGPNTGRGHRTSNGRRFSEEARDEDEDRCASGNLYR
jgi:hypothetical protein